MSSLYKIRTDKRLDPERKKKILLDRRPNSDVLGSVYLIFFLGGGPGSQTDTEQLLNRYTYLYTPRYLYIHRYVHTCIVIINIGPEPIYFILFYFSFFHFHAPM